MLESREFCLHCSQNIASRISCMGKGGGEGLVLVLLLFN